MAKCPTSFGKGSPFSVIAFMTRSSYCRPVGKTSADGNDEMCRHRIGIQPIFLRVLVILAKINDLFRIVLKKRQSFVKTSINC